MLVEHRPFKAGVPRSTRGRLTKFFKEKFDPEDATNRSSRRTFASFSNINEAI